MDFKSVDDVLDFAITREEEAASFYTQLAERAESSALKTTLLEFAKEEEGHKAKLEAVKRGDKMVGSATKVVDLKIGDYLVDIKPSASMTYQEALVLAMKAEKTAFMLYTDLAAACSDPTMQKLFLNLAQEEAKHKLRFEVEYDENVMTEN